MNRGKNPFLLPSSSSNSTLYCDVTRERLNISSIDCGRLQSYIATAWKLKSGRPRRKSQQVNSLDELIWTEKIHLGRAVCLSLPTCLLKHVDCIFHGSSAIVDAWLSSWPQTIPLQLFIAIIGTFKRRTFHLLMLIGKSVDKCIRI